MHIMFNLNTICSDYKRVLGFANVWIHDITMVSVGLLHFSYLTWG
jgi:hypothetical protein